MWKVWTGTQKKAMSRTGGTAQCLGALAAPPDDPGSIPSASMVAPSCLLLQLQGL